MEILDVERSKRTAISDQEIKQYYTDIAPRLTNYLVSNGLDYSIACDIVQETFIRLWKKRDQVAGGKSVSGFVFAVAKNLRNDHYRKNKFFILQDSIDDKGHELETHDNVTGQTDIEYLRDRLQDALLQLPEKHRTAYTMFHIGEMSIKEIAESTQTSQSSVKIHLFRARKKLQTLLQDLKGKDI